ncbi:MAG: hypothetical protein WAN50_02020 [Minisyncoccia bacterium]
MAIRKFFRYLARLLAIIGLIGLAWSSIMAGTNNYAYQESSSFGFGLLVFMIAILAQGFFILGCVLGLILVMTERKPISETVYTGPKIRQKPHPLVITMFALIGIVIVMTIIYVILAFAQRHLLS